MTVTLQDAITAIQSGDTDRGKKLLAQLLVQDPRDDMAWIWMSATVDEPEQRQYCLERALEINPTNATARAGLAHLALELPDTPPQPPALARVDHGLGIPDKTAQDDPAQTPAFFWPPQPEPDDEAPIVEETFIGDIVAAMNKDENGQSTREDAELDWLLESEDAQETAEQGSEQDLRAALGSEMQDTLDLPAESAEAEPIEGEPEADETMIESPAEPVSEAIELPESSDTAPDFSQERFVSEADLDLPDLLGTEKATPPTATEPAPVPVVGDKPGLLWYKPDARTDRLIAITQRYLISANPDPHNLPEIEAAMPSGTLPRRALGRGARVYPLERITCIRAPEKRTWLEVCYQRDKGTGMQTLNLVSVAQRDKLVDELQSRLRVDFRSSVQKSGLWDILFVPLLTVVVLGLISALLFYGSLQVLANPQMVSAWLSPSAEAWLESEAALNLPIGVMLVGGGLVGLGLIWLWNNLRKPRRTLVIERISGSMR